MEADDKRAILGILIGIVIATDMLVAYTFMPAIESDFGIFTITSNDNGMSRLYITEIPIHHSAYGMIICLISIPILYSSRYPLLGGLLVGFGMLLIIDQIPIIIGLRPWGI